MEHKFKPGTRVQVTYEAVVTEVTEDGVLGLVRDEGSDEYPWYEKIGHGTVEISVLPPESWVPGTVLTANGTVWVVRKSNKKDSYRVMPVDLSGKNRTQPIEEFYARHPSAITQFTPSMIISRKKREELMTGLINDVLEGE